MIELKENLINKNSEHDTNSEKNNHQDEFSYFEKKTPSRRNSLVSSTRCKIFNIKA